VPAADLHPGCDPPHDAILVIGDASDAAPRRPGGLARGDDRFGSGHGGVGAGEECIGFDLEGTKFG
jgi:hypothetical protein